MFAFSNSPAIILDIRRTRGPIKLVGRLIMKKALLLPLFCFFCVPVLAQEHETEHKLVQFQMVLLKRARSMPQGGIAPPLRRQHVGYYQSLLTSGKAIIAGPLQDDPEVSGVAIFN